MQAVVCTRYGPPEVLRLTEIATPRPQPNEVLIRIAATAVTSSDCYTRALRLDPAYRLMARVVLGWNAPRQPVLGMVLSGRVVETGSAVRTWQVGDEVFGFDRHRFGTYAEYVCWPDDALLARRPEQLSDGQAAALPYGGLLAFSYLRKAGVRCGQDVLIYGASGAVGTVMVQMAALLGATVTGVCSTANLDLVRDLGAQHVIDYTVQDLRAGQHRYDRVLDAVGRRKSAAALRDRGAILRPTGTYTSVDDGRPRLRADDLRAVARLAGRGALRPVIDRTYPLTDIVGAHRYVDAGHKRGNVVVSVP